MLKVGIVRWFDPFRGYGFIECKNGIDIYVHFTAINGHGFRSLEEGERVTYQVARGKNGPMAINVTPMFR